MTGVPPVEPWVVELVEDIFGGAPFAIGDKVAHPDGRTVQIVGGRYWGERGISNHWTWREVLPGGDLGATESGYGWGHEP